MSKRLTQPKVDHYLRWLQSNDYFGPQGCIYDDESNRLLDDLFELLEQIFPFAENGVRRLWLRAERGPIEDFGNIEEEIANGSYESEEEFIREWEDWFPEETEWYEFQAVQLKDEGYRAVTLRHKVVILQDKHREPAGYPNEITEFVQWLIDGVKECIDMLKAGTYNDYVNANLPPQHRTGKIRRKDFWNIWPEAREEFFEDISAEDVAEFIKKASAQGVDPETIKERLPGMTANDFYRFCAMGYAENRYKGCDLTPKEQYYLHADGRDSGLRNIDADDPAAFYAWLHDRSRGGGHPWEVCRGGNSTHVSLYPLDDENGYYFILDGDAWNRTIETVKFYLALTRAGVPVYLREAHTLADRLAETEWIGIVPEGVFPAYCESRFPNDHIIDFINLPYDDREKFLPFCIWYDEELVLLMKKKDGEMK